MDTVSTTILPLAAAFLLSLHGLRKRSLSPSGAGTGFVVGYTILACPLRAFALALLAFYLLGSRVTKCAFFPFFFSPLLLYMSYIPIL